VTARRIRVAAPPPPEGFDAIRDELGVPGEFAPEALAEADAAARAPRLPAADLTAIEFFTIDPPGARDLDQAMQLERRGSGYRVRYAIADVAAFVAPGGALDAETWRRGVTHYAPDRAVPLHPPVLSAGAASLLPDEVRPAIVWTIDLDADAQPVRTEVARARVRSRAQLDYAEVQRRTGEFALLAEIGERRQALERERGAVHLPLPAQEVVCGADGRWDVAYRAPLPVEGHNAQISLLAGLEGARLMVQAGAGVLRTLPDADPRALAALRRAAAVLGVAWPAETSYGDFVRSLDPADPAAAALLQDATAVMRGAAYAAFDGEPPAQRRHAALAAEYAHVTAPLRRLADRYALECALAACAGDAPPAWVRERLEELPAAMAAADRRAGALERAAIDWVEAVRLAPRAGEVFRATVVDDGLVQLREPAVRARCDGDPPVGRAVDVRLVEADPATRRVRFATL